MLPGGWGWVVVFCSLMVHGLTSGSQLAFGVLNLQMEDHFQPPGKIDTGESIFSSLCLCQATGNLTKLMCDCVRILKLYAV